MITTGVDWFSRCRRCAGLKRRRVRESLLGAVSAVFWLAAQLTVILHEFEHIVGPGEADDLACELCLVTADTENSPPALLASAPSPMASAGGVADRAGQRGVQFFLVPPARGPPLPHPS